MLKTDIKKHIEERNVLDIESESIQKVILKESKKSYKL